MARCYIPEIIQDLFSREKFVLQCPICKTKTGTREYEMLEERSRPRLNQGFTINTPFIPPSSYYHTQACPNKDKGMVLSEKDCPPYLRGGQSKCKITRRRRRKANEDTVFEKTEQKLKQINTKK